MTRSRTTKRVVRYALVGLGHITQVAVIPAFRHARRNSRLAALVSGDRKKREELSRRLRVPSYDYDQYQECLASGEVDAVYIGLPNHLHCEYSVRAAQAGVHVLCEKPMALDHAECERMLKAAEETRVKLMIGYRLHFEPANLEAIRLARSGRLGELRLFDSVFSMQVRPGNIRTDAEKGGGTLYDLGIYCIQAARTLFGAEPSEVFAYSVHETDARFREVDEMTSALLRFPDDRLATFTSSFGASDVSAYRLVGSKASLRLEPAYEYVGGLALHLTAGEKTRTRRFARRDQFAPELLHFSDCILRDRTPEPSGVEGMIDVRIIEALHESARTGRPVALPELPREKRPTPAQARRVPPVRKPRLVKVRSASQ